MNRGRFHRNVSFCVGTAALGTPHADALCLPGSRVLSSLLQSFPSLALDDSLFWKGGSQGDFGHCVDRKTGIWAGPAHIRAIYLISVLQLPFCPSKHTPGTCQRTFSGFFFKKNLVIDR